MNERNIEQLVDDLDWNAPRQVQEKAIFLLSQIDEKYFRYIFHRTRKGTWENAMRVIDKIGCPRNEFFIPLLIEHLKDINWPGTTDAIQLLLTMNNEKVIAELENAIEMAYKNKDFMWIGGLNCLYQKMDIAQKEMVNNEFVKLLDYADF